MDRTVVAVNDVDNVEESIEGEYEDRNWRNTERPPFFAVPPGAGELPWPPELI